MIALPQMGRQRCGTSGARHLITSSPPPLVASNVMALALCCGVVLAVNLGRHAVVRTGSTMSPAPLKGGVALHSDRAVALPVGSRVQVRKQRSPSHTHHSLASGTRQHSPRVDRHSPARTIPHPDPDQAVDGDGAILHGSVVEEREASPTWILGRVRVRFDGWSARFDEW